MGKKWFKKSTSFKTKIIFISVLLIGSTFRDGDNFDIYRNREIKLVPDKTFAKRTDWGAIYYDRFKHIAVASDGSAFVSNSRQHCIHKYNSKGNLVKTFGQKGQGPGDLNSPTVISILDEKYLVVAEYATNRRISLFDLNGNIVIVIKTQKPVFDCLALKENKIAIVEHNYSRQGKSISNTVCFAKVKIMDIRTRESKLILSSPLKHYLREMGKKKIQHYKEKYYLARSTEGNLLVGFSDKPGIKIYKNDGTLIRNIQLEMERRRISRELKEICVGREIESLKRNTQFAKVRGSILTYIKAHKNEKIDEIPDYFYYFYDLKVDSSGNILVLINNRMMSHFDEDWIPRYRIYSVDGTYKGEIKMNYGDYLPRDFHTKTIYKNTLIGLFEKKNNNDLTLELKKMYFK